MKMKMEKNVVSGYGKVNSEQRRVEIDIDKENAKREAFGEGGFSGKEVRDMEYEQYRSAMELVREKGSDAESKSHFAKDLKNKLSEALKINESYIKIYNASNTPLDKYHMVSAWIEISEASDAKGFVMITLDVFTENGNKRDKADINFKKPNCGFNPENKKDNNYIETLEYVSGEIVEEARGKIKESRENQKKTKGNRDMPNKRTVTFNSRRGRGREQFVQ